MQRWIGKVAVVTGASSGIGAAIAVELAKCGMKVVGLARRNERIEDLRKKLPGDTTGNLYALKCDLTKDQDIVSAFEWVSKELGAVHVLVNNAGISHYGYILDEGNEALLRKTLDTNLWAMIMCTKKAVELMRRKEIIGGHIVNINSVGGHGVPFMPNGVGAPWNIYYSTKHGITAATEALRQEFCFDKSKTKVTSISPGIVNTEIIPSSVADALSMDAKLNPEDIAQAVLYVLGTPPRVQVHELTIKPVGEAF